MSKEWEKKIEIAVKSFLRAVRDWWQKVLVALDQLANALAGGWPDETISSRAWRWEKNGTRAWTRKVIDALFFWDAEHCRESYESEKLGRQLPPELRR